ncbi:uncharacterized protein HaLaN_06351, partial [Haematococcus lacustris]
MLEAGQALLEAEQGCRLPAVRSVGMQVAGLESELGIAMRKAELAEGREAEARRQKTELLTRQDDLAQDLRSHLAAEAARADKAEVELLSRLHQEQQAALQAMGQSLGGAQDQASRKLQAALQAMQREHKLTLA